MGQRSKADKKEKARAYHQSVAMQTQQRNEMPGLEVAAQVQLSDGPSVYVGQRGRRHVFARTSGPMREHAALHPVEELRIAQEEVSYDANRGVYEVTGKIKRSERTLSDYREGVWEQLNSMAGGQRNG